MESHVFIAVMLGAVMHASWNAVIKVGLDRFSSILLLSLVQGVISLGLLAFFPLPSLQSLPWLLASIVLHVGYKLFLIRAYQLGDLSQIYPLARGTAPLIVSIVSALFLGEILTLSKSLGIVAIGLGIMVMAFAPQKNSTRLSGIALLFALGTAFFTAAYTLVDGIGAREALTASGFTLVLFAGDGMCMLILAIATRGKQAITKTLPEWKTGLIAGSLSLGSYWIAIWAMTKAPIALVSGLRESSVLFAMLIAVIFLKEKTGPLRWLSACAIATGIIMTRI
ncbi:EamA family transporter [Kiloniella laminariae]|uniref:EamA family transporter n=1 Tax=Kiloniella laminariae TaxID=454162 RepID=A0ABT4LND3_9PROT|nr:EamA family transporter [Kiloniella laminariae]MCZ4281457.1 EamA family transporter [Kiloniella laminariae]